MNPTVTAVAPNINVKSYSSGVGGPGHQNNNQFNSNSINNQVVNDIVNNSDTTKVVVNPTMKSQNHTSVNCAVKVPGVVSRGQNGPNANKNNTTTPVAHGPAHKPAAHGPTPAHVGSGGGVNSDNCTMPKRPRTKNTSGGGGPGIPVTHGPAHKPAAHGPTTPYVGITTNKNSESVRIHFS